MSWLAGSSALALGCADSVRVSKWRTAELVDQYSKHRNAVIRRDGRRYYLGPENDVELEVDGPHGGRIASAPLGQVRTKGEQLVFPDGTELHPGDLEAARLIVRGERLESMETTWNQPVWFADTVPLNRSRIAQLVDEYSKDHEAVLLRGGRRYRLAPENELVLGVAGWYGKELSLAPLERVRTKGELLVFPNGMEVHSDKLTAARLVVHGEELARLEPHWNLPARHRPLVGFQFGGTSFFQVLVRLPIVNRFYVEAGLMTLGYGWNGSASLFYELPLLGNLSAYAGAGPGFGVTIFASYVAYWQGRLGLGHRFRAQNLWIGVDGGAWYGVATNDALKHKAEPILWPMGGFAFLYEL